MKKIILLTLCGVLTIAAAFAQKVIEKTLPVAANQEIDLQLKFGNDIKITAWDQKEVYIKVTYSINSDKLNDAFKINFDSGSAGVKVAVDLDQELLKNGRAEDCPDRLNDLNRYYHNNREYYSCTTINYEIKVPRAGNLIVNTINGNVELRGVTGPVNAKSISGFVDMSWPGQEGASVALKTITGEVYSDLDLDIAYTNKPKEMPLVGYQLKGNVNGGGVAVKLETISNNVYLRRGK